MILKYLNIRVKRNLRSQSPSQKNRETHRPYQYELRYFFSHKRLGRYLHSHLCINKLRIELFEHPVLITGFIIFISSFDNRCLKMT